MKIAITGSNGFIGKELRQKLTNSQYTFVPIPHRLLYQSNEELIKLLSDCDIIINLAGVPILQRWTRKTKLTIYQSRVVTTKILISAIKMLNKRPKKLISISAIGIYDSNREHDEHSHYLANDFLAKICKDWESNAMYAKNLGLEVYIFRLGIVLGKNGGLFKKLLPIFKLGLGATISNGHQPMSFIHIDDLINIFKLSIEGKLSEGTYNVVSPTYTTNKEFSEIMAHKLHRPLLFKIPSFLIKLFFGKGSIVLLNGQKVRPAKLIESNFTFKYKTIKETIESLINKSQP